jgi:hypothetical protein
MSNKQQTAVERLWISIMQNPLSSFEDGVKAYKQAKAMEKEQIIDAHNRGIWAEPKPFDDGEQYYNETYGDKINEQETKLTGEINNPDNTDNITTDNKTITTADQNNTGTYPEPNQIWQHYKGGRYEIIAMCNHTTTNEVMVIYKSLSFNGFHARPYSEWHDKMWNKHTCLPRDVEYCIGVRFKLIK